MLTAAIFLKVGLAGPDRASISDTHTKAKQWVRGR